MTYVEFLSTLSLRRATTGKHLKVIKINISIHALLAESDHHQFPRQSPEKSFLSTLSLRRATRAPPYNLMIHQHFYPRSPCGERPLSMAKTSNADTKFLSTLSLRRATQDKLSPPPAQKISIHALLAESDHRNASCLGRH